MLLRGIGNEVDMDYGVNESGTTDNKAHNFLEDIGYQNAKTFDYTESRTRMMIVERGFPVYVSGYDSTAKKGHAWVIDGVLQQHRLVERVIKMTSIVLDSHMEARTLFHCNFGWKGQCDGYYYAATFFQLSSGPTSTEGPMDIDQDRDRRYAKDKVIITYTGW